MKMLTSVILLCTVLSSANSQRNISVDLKDVGVRDAFVNIFKGTGINHVVMPNVVQSVPIITLVLKDVELTNALSIVSRTYGLKCSKDKDTGVYFIELKMIEPVVLSLGASQEVTPYVEPKLRFEPILFTYIDAYDAYALLTGQQTTSSSTNMLNQGTGMQQQGVGAQQNTPNIGSMLNMGNQGYSVGVGY